MTGVVLCGGESRRMGNDKGLLLAENESWARVAYNKLMPFVNGVVVSVNAAQLESYSQQFEASSLVEDSDMIDVHGPLHGLLSVHFGYPGQDLFVLACDMLAMDVAVLTALFIAYQESPENDCYLFQTKNGIQPLAGIYTNALLKRLVLLRQNKLLEKFSMKHVLQFSHTHIITAPPDWEPFFENFNFKENLNY